ncbi:MAG: hypothetical protein K0R41_3558 [Geminicoccaceae bacterium]|jgi:hypothetical protein|nr:hypothetical protein [Geminicoccaceae bacterium]
MPWHGCATKTPPGSAQSFELQGAQGRGDMLEQTRLLASLARGSIDYLGNAHMKRLLIRPWLTA